MKFINIGFGSFAAAAHIVAVISPDSAPVRRSVQEARTRGSLIDATYGRRAKSVLQTDSGHLILSALPPETIAARAAESETAETDEGEADPCG